MKKLTAKDIMTTDVITVRDDMNVHDLANFFTEEMISGAPVVDEDNRLIGVVSVSDIVRNDMRRSTIIAGDRENNYYLQGWQDNFDESDLKELHLEKDDGLTVADIMTPLLFKVSEAAAIAEMADIMIKGRIHRLLVTRDDKVVGIITTLDMLTTMRAFTK